MLTILMSGATALRGTDVLCRVTVYLTRQLEFPAHIKHFAPHGKHKYHSKLNR